MEDETMQRERGRPTLKTPELEEKILGFIEAGFSNIAACEAAGISPRPFYQWLSEDEDFKHRYARANEIYADRKGDAIVNLARHIADTPEYDANKGRLLIDTEKWHLAKNCPKKYSDKQQLDVKADISATVAIDSSDKVLGEFLEGIKKQSGAQGGQ